MCLRKLVRLLFLVKRRCGNIKKGLYVWEISSSRKQSPSRLNVVEGSVPYQAKSTSSVGTPTLMGYARRISKYRSYLRTRRFIVEEAVGEWIQSIACIFSIKEPWRMTAPTRSRAKIEELSQYRDIIRRIDIFSDRFRVLAKAAELHLRTMELLRKPFSINLRILSMLAGGLRHGSVASMMILASASLMKRLGNRFESRLSRAETSGRPGGKD